MFARKTALTVLSLSTTLFALPAHAIDEQHWRSAGFVSLPGGSVVLAEYESKIQEGISLGWRVGYTKYSYVSGGYSENGTSLGVEGTFRYYIEPVSFRGRYWGWGMGLWSTSYSYNDYGTPGSGNKIDLNINSTIGWKLRMSRGNYYMDPHIVLGLHTGLGFYAGLGVQFGSRF